MSFYRNINSFGKHFCDVLSKILKKNIFATAALYILGLMHDLSLTKFEIQIMELAMAIARKQNLQCWRGVKEVIIILLSFYLYWNNICSSFAVNKC